MWLLDAAGKGIHRMGPTGRSVVAKGLAVLAFSVLRLRRSVVLENLARALPHLSARERVRIGLRSYWHFLWNMMESLGGQWIFPAQQVSYGGREHLDKALARGGIYALVIHMGHFNLMASRASQDYRGLRVLTKPVGKGAMADWVDAKREELNIHSIRETPGGTSRARQILRSIAQGEIVAFLADQRRTKGTTAPLFGALAQTNSGLFNLWKTRPAPILPLIIHRTGPSSHRIVAYPELEVAPFTGDMDAFLSENTLRMNRCVEAMVLACPEEYLWLHKRWKGAPAP